MHRTIREEEEPEAVRSMEENMMVHLVVEAADPE
jgi:hypothetical protein